VLEPHFDVALERNYQIRQEITEDSKTLEVFKAKTYGKFRPRSRPLDKRGERPDDRGKIG